MAACPCGVSISRCTVEVGCMCHLELLSLLKPILYAQAFVMCCAAVVSDGCAAAAAGTWASLLLHAYLVPDSSVQISVHNKRVNLCPKGPGQDHHGAECQLTHDARGVG